MARIPTMRIIEANPLREVGGTAVVFRTTASAGAVVTNPLGATTIAKPGQQVYDYIPAGPYTTGEQGDYSHRTAKISTSSTRFGSQGTGKYIINLVTREIAGISDTRLVGAGIQNRNASYNIRESRRSLDTTGKIFNGFTGRYTTTFGTRFDEYVGLGGTVNDNAARPTLAIPGEFIENWGTKGDPLYRDYRAKTG